MNIIDGNGFNPLNSQAKHQSNVGNGPARAPNTNNQPVTPTNTPESTDDQSVQISSEGRQLNQLEKAMTDTQAFQKEKVSLIKQAIDDGTYKPDPSAIAQKLMAYDQQF